MKKIIILAVASLILTKAHSQYFSLRGGAGLIKPMGLSVKNPCFSVGGLLHSEKKRVAMGFDYSLSLFDNYNYMATLESYNPNIPDTSIHAFSEINYAKYEIYFMNHVYGKEEDKFSFYYRIGLGYIKSAHTITYDPFNEYRFDLSLYDLEGLDYSSDYLGEISVGFEIKLPDKPIYLYFEADYFRTILSSIRESRSILNVFGNSNFVMLKLGLRKRIFTQVSLDK